MEILTCYVWGPPDEMVVALMCYHLPEEMVTLTWCNVALVPPDEMVGALMRHHRPEEMAILTWYNADP